MRPALTLCAAIAIAMSGCANIEQVARPPTAPDLAHINDVARHGSLLVRYLPHVAPEEPDQPRPGEPECAGGRCGLAPWMRDRAPPVAIASADARAMTFALADGTQAAVPLESVRSVEVTGLRRCHAALVGAGVGGAVMFQMAALAYLVGHMEPGSRCDSTCAGTFGGAVLGGAATGALIGALVGSTLRFEF